MGSCLGNQLRNEKWMRKGRARRVITITTTTRIHAHTFQNRTFDRLIGDSSVYVDTVYAYKDHESATVTLKVGRSVGRSKMPEVAE